MDYLRQPKKENTLDGPSTAGHVNARGKHPLRKGAPLCLVGPERCAVSRGAETGSVTAGLYCQQLIRLADAVREKRPNHSSKRHKVSVRHDNARPRVASTTKRHLAGLSWDKLPHSAYSRTPPLLITICYAASSVREGFMEWVSDFFGSKPARFYYSSIHALPEHWQRVLEHNGNYIR
ncbi:hypothetical protein M514_12456 [Trichuris suis]|uniref:Uncharacterized protein n=1 Tax=Trichuris suis TaxID=68888 RepID=A0A085ND48_9BILA|nr:hypothetical protein M514_12456 [Trichuris suis]